MADNFTYTRRSDGVIVRSDGVIVPTSAGSSDRQLFEAWLAQGNTPTHAPVFRTLSKPARKAPSKPAKPPTPPAKLSGKRKPAPRR